MISNIVKQFELKDKEDTFHGKRVLTTDQAKIFKGIIGSYKQGGRAFLQGGAGCGKSVLICAIKKWCDSKGITCEVTASTGKASSALGGVTIHSYLGLSMKQNDRAESVEDALTLGSNDKEVILPHILIIDEASMIGKKLLDEIMKIGFNYILFVGDLNQLPPVKDKKVEWKHIVNFYYELTKTLRTKDPALSRMFDDYKKQKEGIIEDLNIFDYVNDRNIIEVDYSELDTLPKNAESCFIGYRNKLVEQFADKLTNPTSTMFNLNVGVTVTALEVGDNPTQNDNGYYNRDFVNRQKYFNGEDVEILKLDDVTKTLVSKGYVKYRNWYLKLTKKGIMITDSTAKKESWEMESKAPKYFISFPLDEVLEYCTLSLIGGDTFSLVWDGSEEEFKDMLEYYFKELQPHLKIATTISDYHKGKDVNLSVLPYDIRQQLTSLRKVQFLTWYEFHEELSRKKKAWTDFLTAKSVISARSVASRTTTKAQGISVPCTILCEDSFYGASNMAQYVAVTRAKLGMILVKNVPSGWKSK